jgi:PKD repeat protein/DNA-binding MarR family transcriptional regulator
VRNVPRPILVLLLGAALGALWIGPLAGGPSAIPTAAPIAAFGLSLSATPSAGPAPLLVTFALSAPNGSIPSTSWDFGDGTHWNSSGPAGLAPVHRYESAGNYTAHVAARWGSGYLNASVPIRVLPTGLSVTIHAAPLRGVAPLTVAFQGAAAGGSGTYASFLWQFGSAGSGEGVAFNYTFPAPGNYTVDLSVLDSWGDRGGASVDVQVLASSTPSPGGPSTPPSSTAAALRTPIVDPVVTLIAGGLSGAAVAGWSLFRRRRSGRSATERPAPPAGPTALSSAPAAPAPLGPGPPEEERSDPAPGPDLFTARRLTHRLLRHLAGLAPLGPGDVATPPYTQAGIAEALGSGRSAVSKILSRLEAAGIVSSETDHVVGSSRRVRVYRLTPRGERLGRALREPPGDPPAPDGGAAGPESRAAIAEANRAAPSGAPRKSSSGSMSSISPSHQRPPPAGSTSRRA